MTEITMLAIPGGPELFIVLGVILLLFGSTKLPKLARSLGASVTEFKKGVKSGDGDGDPEAKRLAGEKSETTEKELKGSDSDD